ncbi:hypothetical protein [Photorhabdus bodei]|uniref:Uncharacterized protein n=1 Tax=Photorhabdus bodei TaxID=2029681 RepID=A0AAW6BRM7_9GAMM|nr:hypothetical protein [Photorhabdus bodei]MDB6374659.1 hypothetical protein [Photorhabdus bodei]
MTINISDQNATFSKQRKNILTYLVFLNTKIPNKLVWKNGYPSRLSKVTAGRVTVVSRTGFVERQNCAAGAKRHGTLDY